MPRLAPLQVFVALDGYKAAPPAAEADLAPVQTLINEAYQGALILLLVFAVASADPCVSAGRCWRSRCRTQLAVLPAPACCLLPFAVLSPAARRRPVPLQ